MAEVVTPAGPSGVVWDITYACPLRCSHCYSESGRRPSAQLGTADLLRVADALVLLGPRMVAIAGGEPLLVPGLVEVVERLRTAGIGVLVYTGGWALDAAMSTELLTRCSRVRVSVDGTTAGVHDRIRGRAGSFDRAMAALAVLGDTARGLRANGTRTASIGIEGTVCRSGFHQVDEYCTTLAPRFPELGVVALSAAIPIGLASRPGFVATELLTDEQFDILASPELYNRLRALLSPSIRLTVTDNRSLRNPLANGDIPAMQVEPDGNVRGLTIHEGTVGNLLTEPPAVLWERSLARWNDPFVVRTLAGVTSVREWAAASRRLDAHFADERTRARIARRPGFP